MMELDEKYASVILRRYVENTNDEDNVMRNGEKHVQRLRRLLTRSKAGWQRLCCIIKTTMATNDLYQSTFMPVFQKGGNQD